MVVEPSEEQACSCVCFFKTLGVRGHSNHSAARPMVMEIETAPLSPQQREYNDGSSDQRSGAGADAAKPLYRNPIVVVNFLLMALGTVCGPLLFRAYFLHGGTSKWLTCLLQTAGWPLLLPPLCVSFFSRRRRRQRDESATETEAASISLMSAGLLAATVAIGLIDFLYAYGLAYLPVSTSSILVSTQLAFTAVFALLVVRQRFTAFSVNAVVLLVVGAAMLGLNGGGDRPAGVSRAQYYAGFAMTLGSAALYGLVLPLMELSQARHAARAGPAVTYTLVLEIQMVIGITATAFSGVGMLVNKDFHEIPDEARRFDLGEAGYYFMLVSSATAFQCFFIGTIGAIFYGSALLAGVIMTLLISIIEVFAVLLFHEPFNGTKGVALAISVWGFISYFYGEIRTKEQQSNTSTDKEHLDPYINLYCGVVCTFQ